MNNNNTNLPAVRSFNYEGKDVRNISINGEPWFAAKDICEALEIVNYRDAIQALDEDERRQETIPTPSNGGYSTVNVINQPGVFKLAFRGRKEPAKRFTRWVTHEVLPEIFRTGSYTAHALRNERIEDKSYMSKARFSAVERIINAAFRATHSGKEEDFQKAIALDRVFQAETGYSALEKAGLKLNTREEKRTDMGILNGWRGFTIVDTYISYHFEWRHDLPSLPDTIRIQEDLTDSELRARGLLR